MSVVTLDKGEVRLAEIEKGHGTKQDGDRNVEFGSENMVMNFADGMLVDENQRRSQCASDFDYGCRADHCDREPDGTWL